MIFKRASAICLAAAVGLLAGAGPSPAQQRVGVNSAVNPEATGTPPGGTVQRLVIGHPVVFNERIATANAGQTQILFLDESAMTVGPNSDLTIDRFVYDPNTGAGRLTMSATRGIMRFVGGKLSKQDNGVELRGPSATLAVRGGVFLADLEPNGRLDVHFVFGAGLSVTGLNGLTQNIGRAGFSITVPGPGSSPSAPYPTPPEVLARLTAALDGRTGGTGGSARPPSNATIIGSGINNVISGDITASLQAAAQSGPLLPPPAPVNPANAQINFQVNTVQAQGTPAIELIYTNPSASSGPTTANYPVAVFISADSQDLSRVRNFTVSSAVLKNGVLSAVASDAAVSFPLSPGTNNFGPAGTAGTFGATSGTFSGTSYLSPDNSFFYAVGTSPSFPNQVGALAGGIPTVNLPTTGTGSFTGSATGSVFNNGSAYLATGNFTNTYNFGTNAGNVTISNFDGKTFSASVAAVGTPSASAVQSAAAHGISLPSNIGNLVYSGNLSGSGVTGFIGGAFFGYAASSTGGVFGVNNSTNSYVARGVFGASR